MNLTMSLIATTPDTVQATLDIILCEPWQTSVQMKNYFYDPLTFVGESMTLSYVKFRKVTLSHAYSCGIPNFNEELCFF